MRLTKYEHACLVLTEGDAKLVVDPGGFTTPLVGLRGVVAVVVTHEHPDHWTPDQLDHLRESNPDLTIYGPAGVVAAATGYDVHEVHDGDALTVGPFDLAFHGSRHAVIHESIPVVDNVGVLVDGRLFVPGDQFTVPPVPVETLAVPIGAPWSKVAEVMDYADAVKATRTFPVHEGTLSQAGLSMHVDRLKAVVESYGGDPRVLQPHETIDL
ncbi:MBL fold metallo-hydrolase [Frigoribacterium salinisoli]